MANKLNTFLQYIMEQRSSKRLKKILSNNLFFEKSLKSYIIQLQKKKVWKDLEFRMLERKDAGWKVSKLKTLFNWERNAYNQYTEALNDAINNIKKMSQNLTKKEAEELKTWIKKSPSSQKAWDKNDNLSIDDSLRLIEARVVHLAYMDKHMNTINIGEIIKS